MEQWPDTLQSYSQFTGSTLQLQAEVPCYKNHSLSNCSLLGSLYHVQHALLKGPSTRRVWHSACADALSSRD